MGEGSPREGQKGEGWPLLGAVCMCGNLSGRTPRERHRMPVAVKKIRAGNEESVGPPGFSKVRWASGRRDGRAQRNVIERASGEGEEAGAMGREGSWVPLFPS